MALCTHCGKELPKRARAIFVRPTIEEVTAYCSERKNGIDPQSFLDSNDAKGWVIGKTKTPAKCWKAMIRTWENNRKKDKPDTIPTINNCIAKLIQDPSNRSMPTLPEGLKEPVYNLLKQMGLKWPELHRKVRDHELDIDKIAGMIG